jgi:hypothetical protein
VSLRPRVQKPLEPALSGRFEARVPKEARILLDGEVWAAGPVPLGRHLIRSEREGFISQDATITVEAGKTVHWQPDWRPTRETLVRDRAAARQRTIAWGLAGASVAFLGAGAGTYFWNNGRYASWRAESDNLTNDANLARVASLQRADDIALGMLALGVGLGLGATWLSLSTNR